MAHFTPSAGGERWTCRSARAILILRQGCHRAARAFLEPCIETRRADPIATMNARQLQLQGIGDPRLAVHAASALAAWLWSTDGAQVLWANPVGASLFGASNMAELARKTFGPADALRRQVVQLAGQLSPTGAIRLERLRGFGASTGMLMTCSCARLDFPDGSHGILIAATEASQRIMPLTERLRLLVQGFEAPIAAFARDGMFIAASEAARPLFGFRDLAGADFDEARNEALRHGRAEMRIGIGRIVLQRVGSGNEVGIVALIATDGPHGTEPPKEDAAAPPARPDASIRPARGRRRRLASTR